MGRIIKAGKKERASTRSPRSGGDTQMSRDPDIVLAFFKARTIVGRYTSSYIRRSYSSCERIGARVPISISRLYRNLFFFFSDTAVKKNQRAKSKIYYFIEFRTNVNFGVIWKRFASKRSQSRHQYIRGFSIISLVSRITTALGKRFIILTRFLFFFVRDILKSYSSTPLLTTLLENNISRRFVALINLYV